ncbi:MAG: hemerythrin domain-containing protein [Verrucomicrobia bacterium]|nr:hemerythrin domain-containing protein [Verrucomicrobiota bacterium]
MKITEALLAEHVVFHNLFDYVEDAVPKLKTLAEVKTLARLLGSMLETHSRVEDQLLIEPLEPSFSHMGQAENFHAEHEEIEVDLARLRTTRVLREAKRCLLKAVLASRKHFDKEERIVFPLAERQLSAKSLAVLGKRWEEQRTIPD